MVVVDVLSFTTTVSVALSRGIAVLPYRWNDGTEQAFAEENQASLAVGRSEETPDHPWSLSGAALLEAPWTSRLVLPSPNGSTIAAACQGNVLTASLRNGTAVAAWLHGAGFGTAERPVTVIAAGEQWPLSNALRPALEDILGAGKVISALIDYGVNASIEARTAAATFTGMPDVTDAVFDCSSGRELVELGYAGDVEVACAENADDVVPFLQNNAFIDVRGSGVP